MIKLLILICLFVASWLLFNELIFLPYSICDAGNPVLMVEMSQRNPFIFLLLNLINYGLLSGGLYTSFMVIDKSPNFFNYRDLSLTHGSKESAKIKLT